MTGRQQALHNVCQSYLPYDSIKTQKTSLDKCKVGIILPSLAADIPRIW